jgi:predicted nucleic acid-binding protein
MFILDTNVLSELRPGKPQQSDAVRTWAAKIPSSQFFLSSITVLEHEIGILRLERREPPQGSAMRAWFDALVAQFQGRILSFDLAAAMKCAPFHVPNVKSYRDSMMAATALVHGFTLVTRNVSDFELLAGLKVLNPWELQESSWQFPT